MLVHAVCLLYAGMEIQKPAAQVVADAQVIKLGGQFTDGDVEGC